jgi:hypothetical protein
VFGFSHIDLALNKVTKGGGKENFMWGKSQQQAFDNMKHNLCSSLILSLLDLQQNFDIETNASDYDMGPVLTRHGNLVAYHSETLSNVVHKFPTYEK